MTTLYLLCGESSGDHHGSLLAKALSTTHNLVGIAGPNMRQARVKALFPMEDFQMMGFILNVPKLIKQFLAVRSSILDTNPEAVVFIDYPGFNLRMATSLRKKGYKGKLIHYISPTVWAWGKKRIQTMAESLDLLLTIFPFEKKYFENTTLAVHYVGHPLMEAIDPKTHTPSNPPLLALFPGSRRKEIEKHLPLQLYALKKLYKKHPFELGISLAHPNYKPLFANIDLPHTLYGPDSTYNLMQKSHLALSKSGTVTLELALHNVPTVVMHHAGSVQRWIMKHIIGLNLPYYSIVNILLNQEVFPEWMERKPTPDNLCNSLYPFLTNSRERHCCLQYCSKIPYLLGNQSASKGAAKLIKSIL